MSEWLASVGVELNIVPHLIALLVAIAACGFVQAAETVTVGNAEATARIVEGI